jgi:hypothetical protein
MATSAFDDKSSPPRDNQLATTLGRASRLWKALALGEKAVKAVHRSDLPSSVLTAIDGARKYAEGRAVRVEVRRKNDVAVVEKLAVAKMTN